MPAAQVQLLWLTLKAVAHQLHSAPMAVVVVDMLLVAEVAEVEVVHSAPVAMVILPLLAVQVAVH